MTVEKANDIIRRNEQPIRDAVMLYKGRGGSYEDRFQVAVIGAYKGAMSWDPASGVDLDSFCVQCALRELRAFAR